VSWPLVALARVEAGLGLEQEARGHITEAIALTTQYNIEWTACWGHGVLGFLELSFGRPERAVGELEWVASFAERNGLYHPGALPWAPDLVEAYLRVGRPREASDRLLSAHAGFERLGAGPWIKRAAAELRVAGHDVEGPSPSSFESLTAQELQIALVVGRGATNREAAGELLLSRRTVEHHL